MHIIDIRCFIILVLVENVPHNTNILLTLWIHVQ